MADSQSSRSWVARIHTTLHRAVYRTRQFRKQLFLRHVSAVDAELRTVLSPDVQHLVLRMPAADRAHLLMTWHALRNAGYCDPDLLHAGLLHDVGKCDGKEYVSIIDRIAHVLLSGWAPRIYTRLTNPGSSLFRPGLYLNRHHPALGAEFARQAGISERACWLIAHHHDGTIQHDRDLNRLKKIDGNLN